MMLSDSQRRRYARNLVLPEIGEAGQEKLLAAKVAVVGCGGLGASSLLYLAAAGVGHLTLIDHDRVELSNLQRQVLFEEADIGRAKVEAASDRLLELNPEISIVAKSERLTESNAETLLAGHDLVIDGSDNYTARFTLNEACVLLGIPWVYAAIRGFDLQLSLFGGHLPEAPCYRCFLPEAPPNPMNDCAERGVLGAVAGMAGSLQALEAVKYITGAGEVLLGRLLLWDGLSQRTRCLHLPKDMQCWCGTQNGEFHA